MNKLEKQKIPAYTLIVICAITYTLMAMAWNGLLTEPAASDPLAGVYNTAATAMSWLIMYVFPVVLLIYATFSYVSAPPTKRGISRSARVVALIVSYLLALIPVWYTFAPLMPYEPGPGLDLGPQFGAVVAANMTAWFTIPLAFIFALVDVMTDKRK